MKEQKTKIVNPTTGKIVEGDLVDIIEPLDLSHNIKLSDGTILNMKLVISRVVRVPKQYDGDGNPSYVVQSSNIMAVINSPDNLRGDIE